VQQQQHSVHRRSSRITFLLHSTRYNETQCRLSTWNAMVTIFHSGRARSIGVSNYNITHLQEIVDAGLPLPSINQCPFNACAATPNITTDISCETWSLHRYRGASQMQTLDFCRRHGITFMAYR
jgi:diketogulonate reductase-like aldo/keto reductase